MIKTKTFSHYTDSFIHYIPCGWCLNCRVDKQNELLHRCEKELIDYKSGAFVTLTYDDLHIIDNLRYDKNKEICATLNKGDAKKYLDRLRHNIKNHLPNCILSNHNFKYLIVGEYGGDGQIFDRPHFHILFFGLDFAYCKKEIQRAWQGKGLIKVLPILQGGIAYVLKYLDKQIHGVQAQIKYDENNLERPFQNHSLGLGNSLYKEQLNYIKNHNGKYHWKGKDIPCPAYYKNKFLIYDNKAINVQEQIKNIKFTYGKDIKNLYDLHDFQITKANLRQQNLNFKNRLAGKPILDKIFIEPTITKAEWYIRALASKSYIHYHHTESIPF